MNFNERQIFDTTGQLENDEISTERLNQSWNGFRSPYSRPSAEFLDSFTKLELREETVDAITNDMRPFRSINSEGIKQTEQRIPEYQSYRSQYKTVKVPTCFPGVKTTAHSLEKREEMPSTKLVEDENKTEMKLTLDDVEKVLTPRREQIPGVKHRREEKLPRIEITKAKGDVPNEGKSSSASPQCGSHYFNHARMLTELNEVCSLKSEGVSGNDKGDENLLTLKTVHEARRYSAFTPRGSTVRPHHTRCRSLPNLSTRELPKRFFVKLDPVRASAMQVNLSSWNDTARRCRFLSENLNKLDKQGIEMGEKERKVLIGQWIQETNQLNYQDAHVTTEVDT